MRKKNLWNTFPGMLFEQKTGCRKILDFNTSKRSTNWVQFSQRRKENKKKNKQRKKNIEVVFVTRLEAEVRPVTQCFFWKLHWLHQILIFRFNKIICYYVGLGYTHALLYNCRNSKTRQKPTEKITHLAAEQINYLIKYVRESKA